MACFCRKNIIFNSIVSNFENKFNKSSNTVIKKNVSLFSLKIFTIGGLRAFEDRGLFTESPPTLKLITYQQYYEINLHVTHKIR